MWNAMKFIHMVHIFGGTNNLLSFDKTQAAQITMPSRILHCHRNVSVKSLPSNDRGVTRLKPPFDMTWTVQKRSPPTILLLLHAFVAVWMRLPSHCLPTVLICRDTHSLTLGWEGSMEYTVEFRRHVIHIQFHKNEFRHSKGNRVGFTEMA
jgi:hypothetical protein